MEHEYTSSVLETAVTELSRLPGIGRRTALRLALHLLRRDEGESYALGEAIINLRRSITYCRECHNISESETCHICSDPRRDDAIICVVENIRDVMSIERTSQFNGKYHVLGGVISPLDGVGPDQLEIQSLVDRVAKGNITEVILGLSATMDGDTTNYYIYRLLSRYPVKITQLARGVAVGNELEYTDEVTLGRSLLNRVDFASNSL